MPPSRVPPSQALDDYQRIAAAIAFLQQQTSSGTTSQAPLLKEVAAHVHLSEHHFQRLFSRWAGISPKRYVQTLLLENAKTLLKKQSAFSTSTELNLSSPSRLYDCFVNLIAVTPAEYATQGAGLTFNYSYHETAYGIAFIAQTDRGIHQLELLDNHNNRPLDTLKIQWPQAKLVESHSLTSNNIQTIFSANAKPNQPLSLWVKGTNFQINVWRALMNIQPGELNSYKNIAEQIGKPKASRAVGTAIGSNPAALIIPCHRILRQDGNLGGYKWGVVRKQAMLARELAALNREK